MYNRANNILVAFQTAYAKAERMGLQNEKTELIKDVISKCEDQNARIIPDFKGYKVFVFADKSAIGVKFVEIGKPELGVDFKVFQTR